MTDTNNPPADEPPADRPSADSPVPGAPPPGRDLPERDKPETALPKPPASEPPPPESLAPYPPLADAPPPLRAQRSRSAMPVLTALGLLLLLVGLAWLWNQQQQMDQRLAELALPQPPAIDPARLQATDTLLDTLQRRLTALEQAPPPPAAAPPAAAPVAVDLGPLEARIAALETRQPPPADTAAATAPLLARLDSLAAEVAAAKAAQAAAATQLAELTGQLKAAEQKQTTLAERAAQAQTVARAQVALSGGQPLGDMPDAPPALARFASSKPPTDAELRLSFPAAADAAEQASQPSVEGKSVGERMWLRARSLVTVKKGDAVLVGAPAATVLGTAQARLDAGDLSGAVAALDGLDGPAARAMAAWRGQAQALLDARAALAKMARG